jgi:hypothetical protein
MDQSKGILKKHLKREKIPVIKKRINADYRLLRS